MIVSVSTHLETKDVDSAITFSVAFGPQSRKVKKPTVEELQHAVQAAMDQVAARALQEGWVV